MSDPDQDEATRQLNDLMRNGLPADLCDDDGAETANAATAKILGDRPVPRRRP
jgi:hypothetical protein